MAKNDMLGLYTLDDATNSLKQKGTSHLVAAPYISNIRLPIFTDTQIFDEWLRLENELGHWWKSLPKCPEKICVSSDGKAENPDKTTWSDPNTGFIGGIIVGIFHPGAEFEMRTVEGSLHGNQCTYDCKGNLITWIPAAGTADLYSPNSPGGFSKHQDHDVATYNLAKKINRVVDYYSVRPIWK